MSAGKGKRGRREPTREMGTRRMKSAWKGKRYIADHELLALGEDDDEDSDPSEDESPDEHDSDPQDDDETDEATRGLEDEFSKPTSSSEPSTESKAQGADAGETTAQNAYPSITFFPESGEKLGYVVTEYASASE